MDTMTAEDVLNALEELREAPMDLVDMLAVANQGKLPQTPQELEYLFGFDCRNDI